MRIIAFAAALELAVVATACVFEQATPDDAVILCGANADCPDARQCDLAAHVCVAHGAVLDAQAPTLVDATFEPPVVGDDPVELVVTADEPLGEAPLLTFDGAADPGFLLVRLAGPSALFSLDASGVAAGAYPLGSVELVDVHGNRAVRLTPGRNLVVDRDAPAIVDLDVGHTDAAQDLPFSANAGTNQMRISLVVDEAVAPEALAVTAGPMAATCVPAPASSFICTCAVTAAFNDGTDRVAVTVADRAGNQAEAAVEIATDLRPPALLDVVTTLRSPSSSGPVGAAVAGGTIDVEVILAEPLGAPPTFTLAGDVAIGEAAVVELTPVRWRFAATVALVGAAGVAALTAEVQDLVGNTARIVVADIPLAHAVISPCPPLDQGAACVDFDGDGDAAISPGCGLGGADCDDTDPLTRSDGTEIPGDGADNDCAGDGDAPIDESFGVFVTAAAPAGGDGTRAAPARTVDEATALLAGRAWLFLRGDGEEYQTSSPLRASVLGGLGGDWTRIAGDRTRLGCTGFSPPSGSTAIIVVDSVDLRNLVAPFEPLNATVRMTLARANQPWRLLTSERFVAVDSEVHFLTIAAGVVGSLIVRSWLNEGIDVGAGSDLLIASSDASDFSDGQPGQEINAAADARIDIVNSLIGTIACDGCRLRVVHSAIFSTESATTRLIDVTGSPVPVDLRNNIFSWTNGQAGGTAIGNDNGRLRALGNLFYLPFAGSRVAADLSLTADDVTALNACTPTQCLLAADNLAGDPDFAATRGHIEITSPAVGAAAGDYLGLPAALAADVDGDCRAPGSADIGLDER